MEASARGKLGQLDDLQKAIKKALELNQLEEAESAINEYAMLVDDASITTFKATHLYQKGDIQEAIATLIDGLIKHPYNYFINVNLAILFEAVSEAYNSMRFYANACKFSRCEQEKENCLESINRIISQLSSESQISIDQLNQKIMECNQILSEADARSFPLNQNGISLVRNVMNRDSNEELMVNLYKSSNVSDVNNETRFFFKTEFFKGKEIQDEVTLYLEGASIVPVSLIDLATQVTFTSDGQEFSFNTLAHNRYHYFRFNKAGKLKINTDKRIFVGNPIVLADPSVLKPKLVLKIFVDGLSYKFLEQNGIDRLMPNTYAFFNSGFTASKCYATSEWTLPSKASINTGRYATNHRLLHPDYNYPFEKYSKLMAEYFKEAGYFTARIDTNWRTTPTFGYYKGFDRVIYQNFIGGADCRDVIMEALEHIETFDEKNNFLSISLMDLHNVPDEVEDNLLVQVNTELLHRLNTQNKGKTSVLTKYDESKIAKYKEEINRLDFFLGILYDFLNKKYKHDEVIVMLHSDHGQTFLEKEDTITHDSRRLVPFLIKGGQVPTLKSDEFIEAVDMLPTLLHACGIDAPENIDGRLPQCLGGGAAREYAITHVLHPNQPYRVAISDNTHLFYFETKENVGNDLSICFQDYKVSLLNNKTMKEESSAYPDKLEKYERIVFDQSKDLIRWDTE